MLISKTGKRFMAFMIAMAFVLSGLAYIPGTADAAAGEAPVVNVLGATLRLNKEGDNNGTQSMKIAVEINNASSASDCAIELTVGTKVCTITTADVLDADSATKFQSKTLYSKDEAKDSVVYAVTVTGIPQEAFEQEIKVVGKADYSTGEGVETADSDPQTKSVDGIVKELKGQYPWLGIEMYDGTLYKNEGRDALTVNDIPASGNVALSSVTCTGTDANEENNVIHNDDGTITIKDTREEGDTEIHVPLPFVVKPGQKVTVTIAGTKWVKPNFRVWTVPNDDKGSENYVEDPNLLLELDNDVEENSPFSGKQTIVCKKKDCDYLTLKPVYNGGRINGLTISSIDVEVEALPEPTPVPTPNPDAKDIDVKLSPDTAHPSSGAESWYVSKDKIKPTENNGVTVEYNKGEGAAFYFNEDKSPVAIQDYSKIVVKFSSNTANEIVRFDVCTDSNLKTDGGNRIFSDSYEVKDQVDIDLEYSIDVSDQLGSVYGIMIGDNWNSTGGTLTIKSVRLLKKEVATPTETPAPTPKPDPSPAISVKKTDASINIDAEIDDAWAAATALPIPNPSQTGIKDTGTSATAKLLWNDKYLYILAEVKDNEVDFSAPKSNDYERDGIEFFLDEDFSLENKYADNSDAFQYRYTGFEAKDPTNDFVGDTGQRAKNIYRGRKTAYKIGEGGYTVEVAIPFASTPSENKKMGFELTVMDCAGGKRDNELWLIGDNKGSLFMDLSLLEAIQLVK